jgi:hypothetical protein
MGQLNLDANNADIIQTIKDSVETKTIAVEKGDFLTRPVFQPPDRNLVDVIQVATLTALVDYLNYKVDITARPDVAIHVVSPTVVRVLAQLKNDDDLRFTPIEAHADVPTIGLLRQFVSQEEAIIELQSKFVDADRRADLLKSLGTIVLEDELSQADDGVTQEFTVRSGIERATKDLTNPVALKPYRTFVDIDQPSSPFVVRLKKSGQNLSICLFEADGGKWRNDARAEIKAFLTEELHGEYSILA